MFRRRRIRDRLRVERNAASLPFINILLGLFAIVALFVLGRTSRSLDLNIGWGCGCGWGRAHVRDSALVQIIEHGDYFWNQEGPYPREHFEGQLSAWLKTARHPQVVITADETGKFGEAVRVLDDARKSGAAVAFETRVRPRP